jgi:small subunit ribosomal protein S9
MITKINSLFGFGRKKTSLAIVRFKLGLGNIYINNISFDIYFKNYKIEKNYILYSLSLVNLLNKYDIFVTVKGGGLKSQLDAITFSIINLLLKINLNYKKIFLKYNLILKDTRIKERRKFGLKKARKSIQYSKR